MEDEGRDSSYTIAQRRRFGPESSRGQGYIQYVSPARQRRLFKNYNFDRFEKAYSKRMKETSNSFERQMEDIYDEKGASRE